MQDLDPDNKVLNNRLSNKVRKPPVCLVSICFVVLFFLSSDSFARNFALETETDNDIGQASIWIMGAIAQGGYFKPSVNLSIFDSEPYLLGEIEGGWRFTNWLKVGGRFERTFTRITTIDSAVILAGAVVGVSGSNLKIGYFTTDIAVGVFELDNSSSNSRYFFEPGFHIKRKLYKRMYWTAGITYRYIEDEDFNLFGSDSFNSLSLKIGITGHRY